MEFDKEQYLKRFEPVKDKKSGGVKNEISELRGKTADLLERDFLQVARLTKGWSTHKLYTRLKTCEEFINPPALWWKLYKEDKQHAKNIQTSKDK